MLKPKLKEGETGVYGLQSILYSCETLNYFNIFFFTLSGIPSSEAELYDSTPLKIKFQSSSK